MAKKVRPVGRHRPTPKGKTKQPATISAAIPVVVSVVVIIVVLGLLLSLGSWRSSPAASVTNPTALALSTNQIPYPQVPRISVQHAREQLARGQIVMVDVRSKAAYDRLHIEGALSMPEDEIESRLDELDRERGIVLYCT